MNQQPLFTFDPFREFRLKIRLSTLVTQLLGKNQNFNPAFSVFSKFTVCTDKYENWDFLKPETRNCEIYLHDLMQMQITSLIENKRPYIQSMGYKLSGDKLLSQTVNLANKLILTNFEPLLMAIGEHAMRRLLLDCYIFYQIDETCCIQVSGMSVMEKYWNKDTTFKTQFSLSEKRYKIQDEAKKEFYGRINRNLIFFCSHMNRQPGFFKRSTLIRTPIDEVGINRFLLAIFPKALPTKESSQELKPHLIRMLINARTTDFNQLMSEHCPLPKSYSVIKSSVAATIQSGNTLKATDYSTIFSEYVPYEKVTTFLMQSIRRIIPQDLLGPQNYTALLSLCRKFIRMKRFETILIKDLVGQFKWAELPWLRFKFSKQHQKLIFQRNEEILKQLIVWIFNYVIIELIRANFYVTERHKDYNKIFYYRKPLWKLVTKLALESLRSGHLAEVQMKEIMNRSNRQTYPISKLRILPKNDTYRPIMTFFRKNPLGEGGVKAKKLSLNQMLFDTQKVLRRLKDRLGDTFGYSVFDNSQIFVKYNAFVSEWQKIDCPPLYFVTMDIQKCYDSIDTSLLIEFLRKTDLLEDKYLVAKYAGLYRNRKKIQKKTGSQNLSSVYNYKDRLSSFPLSYLFSCDQYFTELNSNKKASIIVDYCYRHLISREQILDHLNYVCSDHLVLYENKVFLQKKGIPQGLNVSSLVSSFYYAHLEEEFLSFLREDVKGEIHLIMRLTDDYLIITNRQETAVRVIDSMLACADKYGFAFNDGKLTTNFNFISKQKSNHKISTQIFESDYCHWIGKMINMKTLEILPGWAIDPEKLFYSVNVKVATQNVFSFLRNKFKSLLLNNSQFYLSPSTNNEGTRTKIILQFFEASIYKIFPFFEEIRKLRKTKNFVLEVLSVIKHSIEDYIYNCLKEEKNAPEYTSARELELKWKCYDLLVKFFKKKHSQYPSLVKVLRSYQNTTFNAATTAKFFYESKLRESNEMKIEEAK